MIPVPHTEKNLMKYQCSDTVGRPPRVLLYRVNKTIGKWFQNFLPKSCKKQPKIERRLKGLKRKIHNIMPQHEFIYL